MNTTAVALYGITSFRSTQELGSVYGTLAAILNIGDVEFTPVATEHQTDKSDIVDSSVLENGETLLWTLRCVLAPPLDSSVTTVGQAHNTDLLRSPRTQ